MLRRLTDAIVCAVLLVLDILAWLIVSTFSSLDRSEPGRIASVSLSALIIVALLHLRPVWLLRSRDW